MENYFEHKGIQFRIDTPIELANKLIELKESKTRIVVDFGDIKTNVSWNEVYDISGYIGKSTGLKPILLLVHNKRSFGGGELSTNKIISIKTSRGKHIQEHLNSKFEMCYEKRGSYSSVLMFWHELFILGYLQAFQNTTIEHLVFHLHYDNKRHLQSR